MKLVRIVSESSQQSVPETGSRPKAWQVAVVMMSAALLGLSTGCASTLPASRPTPPLACEPVFPYQDGWLGGDAGYSLALPMRSGDRPAFAGSRRTLWLFGDSFVARDGGQEQPESRSGADLIHNSIAISRCQEGRFEIEYHWKIGADGMPRAFFEPREVQNGEVPGRYWWLFDGFLHAGVLYLGLLEVESTAEPKISGYPFRLVGMRLAKVINPDASPIAWEFESSQLTDSLEAFPGSAMVVEGEYVYFFSFARLGERGQPRFLSRLELARLSSLPPNLSLELETLVAPGRWERGFLPGRALVLMDDNASEMSVEYHEGLSRWVAVYGSPVQIGDEPRPAAAPGSPSDRVFLRYAEELAGPWSERQTIYRFPELLREQRSGFDSHTICYAAKGHFAFSPADRVLITYVCNLLTLDGEDPWATLERLSRDMSLYRFQSALLPMPPLAEEAEHEDSGGSSQQ